jgi:DNA-directed RNA polymerase specialized sigma24 family protein
MTEAAPVTTAMPLTTATERSVEPMGRRSPTWHSSGEPEVRAGREDDVDAQLEGDFRDFAVARWPSLLRTAILLAPDQPQAERLVQRALAQVHRDWADDDRVAPEAWARSVLVRLTIGRGDPSVRAPAAAQHVAQEASSTAEREQQLARAVVGLPPRVRSALVLCLFDGLGEARAAEALGCPVADVTALVEDGLALLEAAVPRARQRESRPR